MNWKEYNITLLVAIISVAIFVCCGCTDKKQVKKENTYAGIHPKIMKFYNEECDEYTEWICTTDKFELKYNEGDQRIYGKIGKKRIDIKYSSRFVKEGQMGWFEWSDDEISTAIIKTEKNLKIFEFTKPVKCLGNCTMLVFTKNIEKLPMRIVQSLLNECSGNLWNKDIIGAVEYEQISGDNINGEVRVTGIFQYKNEKNTNIFKVEKNNEIFDVYMDNKKICAYELEKEPLYGAVLHYLVDKIESKYIDYLHYECEGDTEKGMLKMNVKNIYYKKSDMGGTEVTKGDKAFWVDADPNTGDYIVYDENNKKIYEYTPQILSTKN